MEGQGETMEKEAVNDDQPSLKNHHTIPRESWDSPNTPTTSDDHNQYGTSSYIHG